MDYVLISVFAFVWCNILIQEGEIFGFIGKWVDGLNDTVYWQHVIIKIASCQNCQAGQIAFWFSVYKFFTIGINVFYAALMITLSIAGAHFLTMINNYLKAKDENCNA